MKKLFTLFAAVMVAIAANAKVWTVGPNHNEESDRADCNLYVTIERLATAGDTLLLADGEYAETLTFPVKHNIYVVAEPEARPVIKMSGYFNTEASIKFKGITFDHTAVESNSYLIYLKQGCDSVVLEDCEVTGFRDGGIMSWSAYSLTKVRMNNCYCHDNKKSIVYLTNNQCQELEITNSTFANNEGSPSYVEGGWSAGIIDIRNAGTAEANQKVRVDHCTFYNNSTKNSDYADVKSYKSTDVVVSNCIFYGPSSTYDGRATHLYGGEVKNCLTINYAHETAGHRTDGATFNDTILNKDPLFVDAANGNFMLQAGSPAIGAATDNSDLGDPHWDARVLYLNPGKWNADGAKYAVWCFGSGAHAAQWSEFMALAEDETEIYATAIPAGYTKVIFARINGTMEEPEWGEGKCWNQTGNLDIEKDKDLFTITDWGTGEWSKYKYEPVLENGFYLVGTFAGVSQWSYADLSAAKKFAANPEAEGEYMITVTLTKDDLFKAIYLENDDYKTWYPDGQDNDYVVTEKTAGEAKTIYFSPTPKEAWGNGHFFVAENDPTAINRTEVGAKAQKCIENGQLIIRKNGKTYNAIGIELK